MLVTTRTVDLEEKFTLVQAAPNKKTKHRRSDTNRVHPDKISKSGRHL